MSHDVLLRRFEAQLDAYESGLASGVASVGNMREYLPGEACEEHAVVLVEMLRITLEHDWSRGECRSIERFRREFPEAFRSPVVLEPLAFEEYRLRIQAGECVMPSEYQARYGVDVEAWPELEPAEERWRSFALSAPHEVERIERACRGLPGVGEAFAGFTLLSELGRGAFARVFLARQEALAGRLVALKVTAGPTVEPRRMARLQHGNIVPIYSVHQQDILTGVCMPFLGCATLADVVRSVWYPRERRATPASGRSIISTLAARRSVVSTLVGGRSAESVAIEGLPDAPTTRLLDQIESESFVEASVRLMARVADGLAHAHARGILHRDLKPANILLADDGEPLILDFNLAEETDPIAGGMALVGGTLPYMSPEQLEGLVAQRREDCGVVDARSDLFSLGVVLHEVLVGRLPCELPRGSVEQVATSLRRAWDQPLPSPRAANPAISPGLAAIISKCLEVDPACRYATASELVDDLERHLTHRPLRHAHDRSWKERLVKWSRRHPRLSSGTAVAAWATLIVVTLACAWGMRGVQLERAAADATWRAFSDELPEVRVLLAPGVQSAEPAIAARGVDEARRLLKLYQANTDTNWRESARVRRLDTSTRRKLDAAILELSGLLAMVEGEGEVINRDAMDVASPLVQAMTLCRARDFVAAADLLGRVVASDPRDAAAWLVLGYCHVRLNDLSRADIDYSMCHALAPTLHIPIYFRGLARLEQKRHSEAFEDLTQTLRLKPDFAEAYFHRALTAQALGRHEEAIADFTRAIDLGIGHTRVYFLRARSHAVAGDKAAAELDRERGMRETPTDGLSYVARAIERVGSDPAAARVDLEQALRLDPALGLAHANLAHVLSERLGERLAAMDCLDVWVKAHPRDALAWGSRAVLHAREGRAAEALRDVEEALRWSRAPFTRYQTACALALISPGDPTRADRARKLIAQALDEDPSLALEMRNDPDLAALKGDSRFARLIGAALVLVGESKVEHDQ